MNIKQGNIVGLAITCLLVIALASCTTIGGPLSITYPPTDNGFTDSLNFYNSVIADPHVTTSSKSKAHIKLALLHAHYRNPEQSYSLAKKHIEYAVSIDEFIASNDSVINMLILLDTTQSGDNTNGNYNVEKLKAELEILKDDNRKLQLIIDQLNELEVDMEKRRKLVK